MVIRTSNLQLVLDNVSYVKINSEIEDLKVRKKLLIKKLKCVMKQSVSGDKNIMQYVVAMDIVVSTVSEEVEQKLKYLMLQECS
jgi:hypothetical protein